MYAGAMMLLFKLYDFIWSFSFVFMYYVSQAGKAKARVGHGGKPFS
jgi:hypothetical protein